MNTSGLLDQLLRAGKSAAQQNKSPSGSGGLLGQVLGGGGAGGLGGALGGAGKGALASGALGMLLGGRRSGKFGGKAARYGSLAALGVMAYKAYSSWQAQQADAPKGEPRTVDRVPPEQAEEHSRAILKALVAAAKADGHVDQQERDILQSQLGELADDQALRQWLKGELERPLDPAEVARAASSPEVAAEMYAASLLMVDEEQYMERAYLDELARQLKLDSALKERLEAEAGAR